MVITMKNSKFLRSALMLVLALVIIGSVTGGTIAWFTDNVEATNNVIQSGTLDIDIQLKDGDKWISLEKNPDTKVFDYNLWEPGYTQAETLSIVNNGNLALKYQLNVKPGDDQVLGANGESLADVIEVYMTFGEFDAETADGAETRKAFHDAKAAGKDTTVSGNRWWYCGTLDSMIERTTGFTSGAILPEGEVAEGEFAALPVGSVTCTIALHMDEDAGNEYQNLSLGTAGFHLQATQFTYEDDSFDHLYDEDAEYGEGIVIGTPKAKVSLIAPENRPDFINYSYSPVQDANCKPQVLNVAYLFQATETKEEALAGHYGNWHADFVVSANKDIPAKSIALAGQYNNPWTGNDWLGFANPDAITAGTEIRLLKDAANLGVSYFEVCDFQNFNCGAAAIDAAALKGTTLKVELRLYEAPSGALDTETGKYVTVGTFVYTFTENGASDVPTASVSPYTPEQLPTAINYQYSPVQDDNCKPQYLDFAYLFQATETVEEAEAGKYANWNADFVISADKDIPEKAIVLAGQYDNDWGLNDWLGFANPVSFSAGSEMRLLKDAASIGVTYKEVCEFKDFNCGATAINAEALKGTTLTVELRLYETPTGALDAETGNYVTVGVFSHKF